MEEIGLLDPLNEAHLFCLHFVYETYINFALKRFVDAWSTHPLRTERNMSPIQLWIGGTMASLNSAEELRHCTEFVSQAIDYK